MNDNTIPVLVKDPAETGTSSDRWGIYGETWPMRGTISSDTRNLLADRARYGHTVTVHSDAGGTWAIGAEHVIVTDTPTDWTQEAANKDELAKVKQELAEARQQIDFHERWKESLEKAAHQEAQDRNWCSDFDDFMETVGLSRRFHKWAAIALVTVRVAVTTDKHETEDDAAADVERQAREELERADFDIVSIAVDEIEEDVDA